MLSDNRVHQDDPIARALSRYAQNILVVIFGLLPLLFIPSVAAPFEYTKVFVVIAGLFVALVLYSLSVLRSGAVAFGLSYPLLALWGVVLMAFLSSLLSGDIKDSLVGDMFSIHATAFVAVLALIPTVWMILRVHKGTVMRMYVLLAISTLVLVVFHILRLVFGADFLSFGVFTGNVGTPVGSWNDLALLLGLTVILSLIALEQLTLTRVGQILFASVTILSLGMLGVINFFMVWLVLGLTSLVMVIYSLGKDRYTDVQPSFTSVAPKFNTTALGVALIVFAASALFVVGGATIGGALAKYTGVSYVEVRPSFQATANIARNVYHENAFLGIGTNKFVDAWRLYKEDAINLTPFWNTEFNAGNGYIPTFSVTTGVLGSVAWLLFLILFVVNGVQRLLNPGESDRLWYFIGVSSFVSAVYVWGMSVVYVPGVVILLLGSLCTGIALSAFSILENKPERFLVVGANKRTGFVLTLLVIACIIGSVSILYVTGRHYTSVYTFNESVRAMQNGTNIDELERQVETAYKLSSSDIFARRFAEYQLARMNALVTKQEPTEEDKSQFERASVLGINAAQLAINKDTGEPANWSVLAGIYSVLSGIGVEGAQERSLEALEKSRELNPKSPLPLLELALVYGRSGNIEKAREYINEAITLKTNYTEAFYFLTQLEIATGNVEGAVKSTQSIITLDPQNPARYYQLGVLESARGNQDNAIVAFEKAISLDTNYANARYLLALTYDAKGRSDDARKQLEVVLGLNPGNTEVTSLLEVLRTEGSLKRLREGTVQTNQIVNEATPTTDENGTVNAPQGAEGDLLNQVNTIPKVEETTTP